MSVVLQSHPVTSVVTTRTLPLRPHCRLASPYHYRRHGTYYLRIRMTGSVSRMVSVSLKTTDRRRAMETSSQLIASLQTFHIERPEALWNDLRDHLLTLVSRTVLSADDVHPFHHWGICTGTSPFPKRSGNTAQRGDEHSASRVTDDL